MIDEERELEGWKREWQNLGGKEDLAVDLAARVARDGARIRRSTIRQVLRVVVSSSIAIWLIVRTRGQFEVVMIAAVVLVYGGVWITRMFSEREGTYRAESEGLDAFIGLTRHRLRAEIRWNAFERRASAVVSAIVVSWDIWAFIRYFDRFRAEPWRAFVSFGFTAVVLVALRLWTTRRKRRLEVERDRFEHLVAERTMP